MNLTKIRNLAGVALLASLAACSGTGSCPPNGSNGELSLKIEAPAQYPAGLPESINAVLTMTNTSTIDANNLKYTVPAPGEAGNYTGVTIIPNAGIDSAAESCINIKAGASCTFTATIGAYANPGSFTVTATPNSSKSSVKQALNKLLGTNSISVTANLGLVDIPDFPSYFYILPDMQTITSNSNGSTTVMLSLLVKDAPENLDNIVLVDGEESSIVLDAKPVVTPSYTVNSVNTYQVTIPAGTDIQKVRAIGYANNVPQCTFRVPTWLGYYAICSNTATINLVGTGTGILSVQPTYVNMNESYESQVITITNIGTGNATNIVYPTISAPFSVVKTTCTASLESGKSCTMNILFTPNATSGESEFNIQYSNGKAAATQTVATKINYSVTLNALLSLSSSSVTLGYSIPQQTITITNIGQATATNITLPVLNSPLYVLSTTCVSGGALEPNGSCTYTISYTGANSGSSQNTMFTYEGGASSSASLEINWSVGKPYVYLANAGGAQTGGVYKCPVGNNGDISYCNIVVDDKGLANHSPRSVAFATVNGTKYLYATISDAGVSKCNLDQYGELVGSCNNDAGLVLDNATDFSEANYIQFATINGVQYAYVGDTGNYNIYVCTLDANGNFASCSEPLDLDCNGQFVVTNIHGIPYIYISETSGNTEGIIRYAINPLNGLAMGDAELVQLSNADYSAGTGVEYSGGLNVMTFNNTSYVYSGSTIPTSPGYASASSGLSMCTLDYSGIGVNCNQEFDSGTWGPLPYSISFNIAKDTNQYAYFGLYNGAYGWHKCDVNTLNGELSNCTQQNILDGGQPYSGAFTIYEQLP